MMLSGIYLGITRETFHRFERLWSKNKVLTYIIEACYWLIQTVIIFIVLYYVNYGEVRLYIILSIVLGYSIYIVLFQATYKRILEMVIKCMRFVITLTVRIWTIFIVYPLTWAIKLLFFLVNIVFTVLLTLTKGLFYPLYLLLNKLNVRPPKKIIQFFNKMSQFCSTIKDKLKSK